jgi:hypothetical protein
VTSLVTCISCERGVYLRSNESAEHGTSGGVCVSQLEVLADLSLLGVQESDGWVGLDVEVGAFRAGLDECSGEGEDSLGAESNVEGRWNALSTGSNSDESLVTSLDSSDGGSGSENVRRVDHGSSSKVGGDTDGLKDTGGCNHGLGVSECGIEVVLARLDRLGSGSRDGCEESRNVNGLGGTNAFERLDLGGSQADVHELLILELGEALSVECRLEVLSGQGAMRMLVFGPKSITRSCLQLKNVNIGQHTCWRGRCGGSR